MPQDPPKQASVDVFTNTHCQTNSRFINHYIFIEFPPRERVACLPLVYPVLPRVANRLKPANVHVLLTKSAHEHPPPTPITWQCCSGHTRGQTPRVYKAIDKCVQPKETGVYTNRQSCTTEPPGDVHPMSSQEQGLFKRGGGVTRPPPPHTHCERTLPFLPTCIGRDTS